jgi:hypothetical protein
MLLDLNKEVLDHFQRIKTIAVEAEHDAEESYSSRAAAMSALSSILRELTKTQSEILSMQLIQNLQAAIVEALEDYDQELKDKVIELLEARLNRDE